MVDEPPQNDAAATKSWLLDKESREGRALFLADWATAVQPDMNNIQRSVEHSVTYGSTGLQAAYIINGGALAALPALMTALTKAGAASIAYAAIPFILGIVSAAISSIAAYLNFQFQAQVFAHDSNVNACAIFNRYGNRATAPTPDKRAKWLSRVNWTLGIGIGAAVMSLVFFCVGAWQFIELVQNTPK